jgi:hypothetical protein
MAAARAAGRAALLALLLVWIAPRTCAASGGFPKDVVVVAAQCHEDVTWLHSVLPPQQLAICAKLSCLRESSTLHNASYDERCSQESRDGFEVASFLRYIVSRLEANDTLPEWLAFVHGHRVAWHHGASAGLLSQIKRARRNPQVGFINVRSAPRPQHGFAHRWPRRGAPAKCVAPRHTPLLTADAVPNRVHRRS